MICLKRYMRSPDIFPKLWPDVRFSGRSKRHTMSSGGIRTFKCMRSYSRHTNPRQQVNARCFTNCALSNSKSRENHRLLFESLAAGGTTKTGNQSSMTRPFLNMVRSSSNPKRMLRSFNAGARLPSGDSRTHSIGIRSPVFRPRIGESI